MFVEEEKSIKVMICCGVLRCGVECLQIGPRVVMCLLKYKRRANDSARALVKEVVSRGSNSLPRGCRKANRKQAGSRPREFSLHGPEREVKVGAQSLSSR